MAAPRERGDAHAVAARALARGDALAALSSLSQAASANDPAAALLRGIAYAQIGDRELAREVLSAAEASTPDVLVRARVQAALAEIAIADGDAAGAVREGRASAGALAALGDLRNAAMQELVVARAETLLGRLGNARRATDDLIARGLDADVRAVALLAAAEIAVREVAPSRARERIEDARAALREAPNALMVRTLAALELELSRPVARLFERGIETPADLFAIEAASRGDVMLVDACRRLVLAGRATMRLSRRPVLFALLRALAEAWPDDVARDALACKAFDVMRVNASHRARLRVEVGRLRKELHGIAAPNATAAGYVLASSRRVQVLLPPTDEADARIAILLSDGAAWTAQEIAEHAGISKRTAQRALAALVARGTAAPFGRGKQARYTLASARLSPIASRLLLLGLVPTS